MKLFFDNFFSTLVQLPTAVDNLRSEVVVSQPLLLQQSIKLLQTTLKIHRDKYGTADSRAFYRIQIHSNN